MPNVVNDPFHRALKALLDEAIEKAVDALSNGSATAMRSAEGFGENVSTAEKYAAAVAQIQTWRTVLALCDQVAEQIHRPAKVNVEER